MVEDAPFTQAWISSLARSCHTVSRLLASTLAISSQAGHGSLSARHGSSFVDMVRMHLHASAMRPAQAGPQAGPQAGLLRLPPEQCALSAAVVVLCRHAHDLQVYLGPPVLLWACICDAMLSNIHLACIKVVLQRAIDCRAGPCLTQFQTEIVSLTANLTWPYE